MGFSVGDRVDISCGFQYGDDVICINKLNHKHYRKIEVGKKYKVGMVLRDSFAIIGISPLYGMYKAECFKLVSDYKKEANQRRLKKVKLLQKPKWYRIVYNWLNHGR